MLLIAKSAGAQSVSDSTLTTTTCSLAIFKLTESDMTSVLLEDNRYRCSILGDFWDPLSALLGMVVRRLHRFVNSIRHFPPLNATQFLKILKPSFNAEEIFFVNPNSNFEILGSSIAAISSTEDSPTLAATWAMLSTSTERAWLRREFNNPSPISSNRNSH